jgi:hypothetical protein
MVLMVLSTHPADGEDARKSARGGGETPVPDWYELIDDLAVKLRNR